MICGGQCGCWDGQVDASHCPVVLSEVKSALIKRWCIVLCARCGQPLRDGVKFCEKCGAKVANRAPESVAYPVKVRMCDNCGCSVTSKSKTCEWCGADLKRSVVDFPPPLTPDGHVGVQD
jgi:hypothetical protein